MHCQMLRGYETVRTLLSIQVKNAEDADMKGVLMKLGVDSNAAWSFYFLKALLREMLSSLEPPLPLEPRSWTDSDQDCFPGIMTGVKVEDLASCKIKISSDELPWISRECLATICLF